MNVMKFALRQINPNPFRRMDHYPIDRQKVKALRESIHETTFWDNIVARRVGDKAEIAYGHHRLVALREEFPTTHEVNLIVRDLDDEQMFKIMARENLEEWAASGSVMLETIRVAVEGYAEGRWELPKVGKQAGGFRNAPGFKSLTRATDSLKPYTAATLATFTGLPENNVEEGLRILAAEEEKLITPAEIKRIEKSGRDPVGVRTISHAVAQIRHATRGMEGPEKREVSKRALDAITSARASGSGHREFRAAVDDATKPKETQPDFQKIADRAVRGAQRILSVDDPLSHDIGILLTNWRLVDEEIRFSVGDELENLSARAATLAAKFLTKKLKEAR